MKNRSKSIVGIVVVVALGLTFLAPIIHQEVLVPFSIPPQKSGVIYSLYKPLGCAVFGIGFTIVSNKAFQGFPHKLFYLSCNPPLPMPF